MKKPTSYYDEIDEAEVYEQELDDGLPLSVADWLTVSVVVFAVIAVAVLATVGVIALAHGSVSCPA